MFKLFTRATWTSLSVGQNGKSQLERLFASFTMRDVLHERSDEMGTLLIRFAKHIAIEGQKTVPLVPTTIRYADYFPVSNMNYFQKELRETPAEQLPYLIIFAFTYRSNADPAKFATVLNEIDALALKQLREMDVDTIFRTLYALLFLMPNWITRMEFFRAAIRELVHKFDADVSTEKFVQLCFYLGLEKKHHQNPGSGSQYLKQLLTEHLDTYLPQLSVMDFAIVCNAAYKTATRLENPNYSEHLLKSTMSMTPDEVQDDLLVTFLKAMRLERVQSSEVCDYIEKIYVNPESLKKFQIRGLIHIFAYLTENLWDKTECTTPLLVEFMQRIKQTRKFQRTIEPLRAKDIDTFIWSSAQLNLLVPETDLEQLERVLLDKCRHNEFQYYPDQLVDSCLYLWILGYKSRQLLEAAIHHKGHARSNMRQQPKVDSRYTVLLSMAAIEEPTWLSKSRDAPTKPFNVDEPLPSHLTKSNKNTWKKYMQLFDGETSVADVRLVCPIKGINIPSLLVKLNGEDKNASVFIEILHDDQMLQFSQEPIAMLRLKIKLLKFLGHKVLTLRPEDLPKNIKELRKLIPMEELNDDAKQESAAVV